METTVFGEGFKEWDFPPIFHEAHFMKLLRPLGAFYRQSVLFSEKYLKLHLLTVLGIFTYIGLFYDGLFILPQRLHTPEFLIALLLGSAALLVETRKRGKIIGGALMTDRKYQVTLVLPVSKNIFKPTCFSPGVHATWLSGIFCAQA